MFAVKIIVLLLFISRYAGAQQSCTTPDNKSGRCLSLGQCPTMIDFLNNSPKPFSNDLKELLNRYVCTYEDEAINTKICCPSDPIDISGRNKEDPPPPPPDVLNHENLKLLPEECGQINYDKKIRGGTEASLREFPWMALLAYNTDTGRQFKCGGSIINENYILTAAHCIVKTPYPLVGVRVGEYSILSEKDCEEQKPNDCLPSPQDLTVEKTIVHPNYSTKSFSNDIALLRVSKINMESDSIQSVCLPVYEDVITQNYNSGTVTGWGFTDPYGINVVDKLQKVFLKKRNMTVCTEAYKSEVKLSYKQICVGGEGIKDSCGGDSGGPFLVPAHFNDAERYVQRGVVSIGHRFCGTEGFPGIYTKVTYYAKWILDNIKP
ncbi:serine protease easter-like isoform X2 [Anoplophora glabripennis]|nr:serine protease easter-like isoform X1 [Anoplophora glabripennis]XP_018569508.1 serine protease easter-like isoform X2 [Anoplophora glabripennis]